MQVLDNERNVFQAISNTLRAEYSNIFIVGEEITSTPPRFPAVTVVQNDNTVNSKYSTFNCLENVAVEEYKIEIYSNLQNQYERVSQAKDIAESVNNVLDGLGYYRTFNHPVPNADATVSRRVMRFRKSNLTEVSE